MFSQTLYKHTTAFIIIAWLKFIVLARTYIYIYIYIFHICDMYLVLRHHLLPISHLTTKWELFLFAILTNWTR